MVAVENNEDRQCEVGSWTGVIRVAAGAEIEIARWNLG